MILSNDGNPYAKVTILPKNPEPPPINTSPGSHEDNAVAFPKSVVMAGRLL